jgi:hypothetical protein
MTALKWLLAILGLVLFGSAGALVAYDVYVASELRRLLKRKREAEVGATTSLPARPLGTVRWQRVLQLALIALLPLRAERTVAAGNALGRVRPIRGIATATQVPGAEGSGEATRLVRA